MGAETIAHCRWCGQELTSDNAGLVWMSQSGHFGTSWCPDSPDKVVRKHEPITGDLAEFALRKRNRELANRMAVRGMWHEGTCVSCGMEDQVIGLPGSEYCKWCEELRVLKPAPPATLTSSAPLARETRPRMLAASLLLAVVGILLTFADAPMLLCATVLTTSFLLGKLA